MSYLKLLSLNVNNFGGRVPKKDTEEWNIERNLKGKEKRGVKIAKWILDKDADIIVLQEFEIGDIGNKLIGSLKKKYKVRYENLIGSSVVLIAFKDKLFTNSNSITRRELKAYARWNEIDFEVEKGKKLKVIGVHVPLDNIKREQFKRALNNITNQIPVVIIGDFNAATNDDRAKKKAPDSVLIENNEFLGMLNNKFTDAWREKIFCPLRNLLGFIRETLRMEED